jgi:site-specific DNA-methyltransferase (adenine-specific)
MSDAGFEIRDQLQWLYASGFPKSHNAGNGWGTSLKPACEPWVLARKPLIGTVAANVLEHGTGAINVDGCRVKAAPGDYDHSGNDLDHTRRGAKDWRMPMQQAKPNSLGRWPANIIHDGSDEVLEAFAAFGEKTSGSRKAGTYTVAAGQGRYGEFGHGEMPAITGDTGTAARFFFSAKADANDRIGSKHPTVKPVDLMQYLVRLVTPKGGTVLDPFAGTGTTGEAAFREGMRCVLIEREPEYQADIARRMDLALAGPDEKRHAILKAKNKVEDAGPLFGGLEAAE